MWYLKNTLRYGTRYLLRDNSLVLRGPTHTLQRNLVLPPEARSRYIAAMLTRSLRRALETIPFYSQFRRYLPDLSPATVLDLLREMPVIERNDLLKNPELFYPNNGRSKPWWPIGCTSGTTGTPLKIFRSYSSILYEGAFLRRHWKQANFSARDRRATLRGDLIIPTSRSKPPFWHFNVFDNQLVISSRHLRREFMDVILDKIRRFKPKILEAYPSTGYELAKFVARTKHPLRIPFVYTGSELLYDHQRKQIEESLGACVMDFYGMAERVAFASECCSGKMHLNTDYSFVEVVDEDNIVTNGVGFITGTTFHNLRMPLIRYKMSDMATIKVVNCACGSAFPILDSIAGKFEDAIYGSDGNAISPSILTFVIKDAKNIRKTQIAQTGERLWEIRVVPDDGYASEIEEKLKENVRSLVDPGVVVEVKVVSEIPRTRAGKYRWVVNEWRGEYRGEPG